MPDSTTNNTTTSSFSFPLLTRKKKKIKFSFCVLLNCMQWIETALVHLRYLIKLRKHHLLQNILKDFTTRLGSRRQLASLWLMFRATQLKTGGRGARLHSMTGFSAIHRGRYGKTCPRKDRCDCLHWILKSKQMRPKPTQKDEKWLYWLSVAR